MSNKQEPHISTTSMLLANAGDFSYDAYTRLAANMPHGVAPSNFDFPAPSDNSPFVGHALVHDASGGVNEYALDAEHDPDHPDHHEFMHMSPLQSRSSKKRRAPRDPHAPPFYTSAFQLFWREKAEYLNDLHRQNPLSLMDRNLIVKKFYDELPEVERQKYRDAANADRERYLTEYAEYMKTPEYAKFQQEARAEMARQAATPTKPRKISAAAAAAHASAQARKNKDGRPKALTAFFLFCNEMRDKVHVQDDTGENKLLAQTKVLTDLWRTMDDQDKQKYRDMYQRQREAVLKYQTDHGLPSSRPRNENALDAQGRRKSHVPSSPYDRPQSFLLTPPTGLGYGQPLVGQPEAEQEEEALEDEVGEDDNVQALLQLDEMGQLEDIGQLDEMNKIAEALVNESS